MFNKRDVLVGTVTEKLLGQTLPSNEALPYNNNYLQAFGKGSWKVHVE